MLADATLRNLTPRDANPRALWPWWGLNPEIADDCKRAENFWSCLTTLRRMVRVQGHRVAVLVLPDGHLHRPDHHLPVLPVVHQPAWDPWVERIQHDAQVQPVLAGPSSGTGTSSRFRSLKA